VKLALVHPCVQSPGDGDFSGAGLQALILEICVQECPYQLLWHLRYLYLLTPIFFSVPGLPSCPRRIAKFNA